MTQEQPQETTWMQRAKPAHRVAFALYMDEETEGTGGLHGFIFHQRLDTHVFRAYVASAHRLLNAHRAARP